MNDTALVTIIPQSN